MTTFIEPPFPEPNEVETFFKTIPDLQRWDYLKDLPFHNDPDVRKARGQKGESFFSSFPKIKTREYWSKPRGVLESAVFFSQLSEGPAGAVHGGAIASAFDHVLGRFMWVAGGFGGHVTLNLNVDYKKFVPIDSVVRISCDPIRSEGKKRFLTAKMTNADGSITHSKCTALFYNFTGKEFPYADAVAKYQHMTKEQYIAAVTNPATASQRAKSKL